MTRSIALILHPDWWLPEGQGSARMCALQGPRSTGQALSDDLLREGLHSAPTPWPQSPLPVRGTGPSGEAPLQWLVSLVLGGGRQIQEQAGQGPLP